MGMDIALALLNVLCRVRTELARVWLKAVEWRTRMFSNSFEKRGRGQEEAMDERARGV